MPKGSDDSRAVRMAGLRAAGYSGTTVTLRMRTPRRDSLCKSPTGSRELSHIQGRFGDVGPCSIAFDHIVSLCKIAQTESTTHPVTGQRPKG